MSRDQDYQDGVTVRNTPPTSDDGTGIRRSSTGTVKGSDRDGEGDVINVGRRKLRGSWLYGEESGNGCGGS